MSCSSVAAIFPHLGLAICPSASFIKLQTIVACNEPAIIIIILILPITAGSFCKVCTSSPSARHFPLGHVAGLNTARCGGDPVARGLYIFTCIHPLTAVPVKTHGPIIVSGKATRSPRPTSSDLAPPGPLSSRPCRPHPTIARHPAGCRGSPHLQPTL